MTSDNIPQIETEVLIVGGGPVGLSLAGDLGWRGIACVEIEQTDGVPDVYETGRVELALAASVVVPPTTSAGSWPKVIDWASRVTDVVRVEAAPAYVASPAWVAVTEQVPSASAVRVEPEIEQTAGVEVAYVTARPELAVAVSGVVPPTVKIGRAHV